jgi:PAS domain S-box-containing protein
MVRSQLGGNATKLTYVKPVAQVDVRVDPLICDHTVQFYEDDRYLVDSLTEFVRTVLDSGDAAVVVATGQHLAALELRLIAQGIDIEHLARDDGYIPLEAEATLKRIMRNGQLDASLFFDLFDHVLDRASSGVGTSERYVSVFGELVALLAADEDSAPALALERLWNELAERRTFSLLCAYSMNLFSRTHDAETLSDICDLHGRVVPAESYARLVNDDERLRSIARLQQRAIALETEIARSSDACESLKERNAELSAFLENSLDGVQQVDADLTIRSANAAMLRILGYEPEEYIGHRISEFFAGDFDDDDGRYAFSDAQLPVDFSAALRGKDGSPRRLHVNVIRHSKDGAFLHALCFVREASDQRRAEAELRQSPEERQRVMAEHDQFISVAAHELKTPITSLRAYAQLLLRDTRQNGQVDPLRLETALDAIELQSGKLTQLVTNILDTTEIDAGTLRVDPVGADLAALIRTVIHREFGDSDNPIQFIGPRSCFVYIDPLRFERVILNLLDNAIKFDRSAQPIVVELKQDAHGATRLTVTDQGVGIPSDRRDAIFERFVQAHGEAHLSGIGLGLYVVRGIVEMHGGEVRIEETGMDGARFTVMLPPSGNETRVDPTHDNQNDVPRVLVVDDDSSIRRLLGFVLEDEGFVVDSAVEGQAALDLIDRQHPDLILLDMKMPGMDGWEFVRHYRELYGHRAPIIVFTAAQNASQRGADVDADDYIAKPFDLTALIDHVTSIVGKNKAAKRS